MDDDQHSALSDATCTTKKTDDKPSHDASIFVGRSVCSSFKPCLSINLPWQPSLKCGSRRSLSHVNGPSLRAYSDKKRQGRPRFKRRCLCFRAMPGKPHLVVGCQKTDIYALQDANSATLLIETLFANPPKPFLGRVLRYEPARAFRTLLVSYRFVMKYVSTSLNNSIIRSPIYLCPVNYSSGPIKDQSTEMELPTAMRIWKHHNSRLESSGMCTRRLLISSLGFIASCIMLRRYKRPKIKVGLAPQSRMLSLCIH